MIAVGFMQQSITFGFILFAFETLENFLYETGVKFTEFNPLSADHIKMPRETQCVKKEKHCHFFVDWQIETA